MAFEGKGMEICFIHDESKERTEKYLVKSRGKNVFRQ